MTPYELAVRNMREYLRSPKAAAALNAGWGFDASTASQVLAVAFMKPQAEVYADLIV